MSPRLALAALLLAAPAAALELGAAIPAADVTMKNVDGEAVSIAAIAGKSGTLVVFTCNHCPWAKAWEERLAALGNAARARGIGVIAINSNDPKSSPNDAFAPMVERARQRGFQFPYVVDAGSTVAKAFGAERTPEVFLFDARGTLVYHGTVDDNAERPDEVKQHFLRDALDAVAAGKPVAVAQTKALGCTIKFY